MTTEIPLTAPLGESAAAAARERLDALTKPRGSLGKLEALAVRLCAIRGARPTRPYREFAVLLAAGDHGVCAEGVSAYPAEVTRQMVAAFLAGHAAINAIARTVGADVVVADVGVRGERFAPHAALIDVRVADGAANFARGAAMPAADVERALAAGAAAFGALRSRREYDAIALGEMGIGNTTSAAAIVAALTGAEPAHVVGRGTGVDDAGLARKRAVVAAAVAGIGSRDPRVVAAAVGGYEIVALAGAILAARRRRVPVVLDGFIVGAAALLATAIEPSAVEVCIAAHRSVEPGHAIVLAALGLDPLLDLDLRLGEGSGAALALPLLGAATRVLLEMKTFAEAGVSGG